MTGTMDGRVAIVTGGGTGIGAATVKALAERGASVIVNYSSSEAAASDVAAAAGQGAVAWQADIADDGQCRRLAERAMDEFGRIDFLVNNAGRTTFANHEDMEAVDAEDFLDIYRLNVVGAFQMIRACEVGLRAGTASAVVNVASIAGLFGMGSSLPYACSKGALVTMTKSLARVLAPAIRVNAVAPGYVGTGWFAERLGEERFAKLNAKIAAKTPMAIATMAEDVAPAIVALLDPAMRAVTGEVTLVDAGAHLDIGLSRRPGRES